MSTCAIRARYAIETVVETVKWKRDKKLILWTTFCYYSRERVRIGVLLRIRRRQRLYVCTSRTACELCGPIKIYKIHRLIHFVFSLLTAWVSWVHFYFARLIAASWQPSNCCRIREIRISSASDVMCVFLRCAHAMFGALTFYLLRHSASKVATLVATVSCVECVPTIDVPTNNNIAVFVVDRGKRRKNMYSIFLKWHTLNGRAYGKRVSQWWQRQQHRIHNQFDGIVVHSHNNTHQRILVYIYAWRRTVCRQCVRCV